jgi:hypothetical protein
MSGQKVFGEVLAGPERRRRWSDDQKREIVSGSLVALAVARRHGISSGLLYTWRRKFGADLMPSSTSFVPVAVIGEPPVPVHPRRGARHRASRWDPVACGARCRCGVVTPRAFGSGECAVIGLPAGVRVHLACGVTDLRKGFDLSFAFFSDMARFASGSLRL